MSVFGKIKTAMTPFSKIVTESFYEGPADDYILYDIVDDRGADYGDGRPNTTIVSVMVHHYMPLNKNYLDFKKRERAALFKAGFTYPSVDVITDRKEGYRHLVYECEIEDEDEVENLE